MKTFSVPALALQFAEELHAYLSPAQMEVVNRNNRRNPVTVCATHDFCDANQLMIDALSELGETFDASDVAQAACIDEAWHMAKRNAFDLDMLALLEDPKGINR